MSKLKLVALCALLGSCSTAATPDAPPVTDLAPIATPAPPQKPPPFTGVVWMSTDRSAAPGTIRIFLPDGTLVMDSCGETYRLARWRALDDRRIEWEEDTARIEAAVTMPADGQLELRLHLVREVKTETYRRATVPTLCPDLAR